MSIFTKALLFCSLISVTACSENNPVDKLSKATHVNFIDQDEEIRKRVIKINFQAESSSSPFDYLIDTGKPLSIQDGGLEYGWSQDVTALMRERNNFRSLDQRFDTLAHLTNRKSKVSAQWQLKLPNGRYQVYLVSNDPSYPSPAQPIKAENQIVFSDISSTKISELIEIEVRDGYLNIEALNSAESKHETKLNFIEIYPLQLQKRNISPTSIQELQLINLNSHTFVYWQNPMFNFDRNYLIQSNVPLTKTIKNINELEKSGYVFKPLDKASNTLLENQSAKNFNYIVSSNFVGKLSIPYLIELPQNIEKVTSSELQDNLVSAVELTKRWSNPEDIFMLHDMFSTHLYQHKHYGNDNSVVADSVWQHRSMSSAIVALQTEKPVKTFIKYWSDRNSYVYESGYRKTYTHVNYLSNLNPNQSYTYKVFAEIGGKEVPIYQGEIQPAQSNQYEPIIINNKTQFPLELNRPHTNYVLTNDIEVDSTAFVITEDNITLDLNGFEIKQRIAETSSKKGKHRLRPAIIKTVKELSKFNLFNGKITQLPSNSDVKQKLIDIDNAKSLNIAGITFEYSAPQTIALHSTTKSAKQLPYNQQVNHNVFIDKGWQISNRHGSGGAVPIKIANEFAYNESNIEVSFNNILRTRQNGIQGATYVNGNEIYVDSWSTNSFAIQPFSKKGKKAGRYQNNRIYLTGYHAIGFGWAHEDLLVENNYIEMQGINSKNHRWWEGFGDQNSLNGLRITNYGKGGQVRNNLKYYSNKIIGIARNGSMMRGTELYSDYSISGTEVRWSEIDIKAEDEESIDVSAVVAQGTSNKNHQPTLYKDSILRSNVALVRFGDSYGRGNNHIFDNVRFEKIAGNNNFSTLVFDGGYTSGGHVIKNANFINGAKFDDVFWRKTSRQSYYSVIDKFGNTVTIRPIEWRDNPNKGGEVTAKRQKTLIKQ